MSDHLALPPELEQRIATLEEAVDRLLRVLEAAFPPVAPGPETVP